MYIYYMILSTILTNVLFNHIVSAKHCTKKEDCSTQHSGSACSFCVGETEAAKCYYPFPDLYNIHQDTGKCVLRMEGACKKLKPCKNGGTCHDRHEELYVCECKPNYVGKQCEQKYNKLKLFYVYDIDYAVSAPMGLSTGVLFEIILPLHEYLQAVSVFIDNTYYDDIKLKSIYNCNFISCNHKFTGFIRYLYKIYNKKKDFLFLGKNVLGYFNKMRIKAIHKHTLVYSNEFRVFVSYPEKNICLPFIQLGGCAKFEKLTVYNRLSHIKIGPSTSIIIPNGNSRSTITQRSRISCGPVSDLIFTWNVWKLRDNIWESENINIQIFTHQHSLTLNPLTDRLDFGSYRVELRAKSVFSGGRSINYAICFFEITSLPLVAIIEGGSHRSVFKKMGLLFSAKNSRDPNQLRADESIITRWSCTVVKPLDVDIGDMCKPKISNSKSLYFIPADVLPEGEFNFTLEIWSDLYEDLTCHQCKMAKMHQWDYQIVLVTNKTNPLISCQVNCGETVTANNELVLKVAYLNNTHGLSFHWTCTKGGNISTSGTPVLSWDNHPSYIFQIPGNTLDPATNYIVSVSVNISGDYLLATYAFETGYFNYSGNCFVSPDSGIKGITYFYINCSTSEREALLFEFYDKTSEEAREDKYLSGRILGMSYTGELQRAILTRGTVVIYIINGSYRVSKTYKVKLTDDEEKISILLNYILNDPSYFQNMALPSCFQFISFLPDIIVNDFNQTRLLNILLSNMNSFNSNNMDDVKANTLILYNILGALGKGNMDFNAVDRTRSLVAGMTNVLKQSVFNRISLTDRRDIKHIVRTIMNIMESSLSFQNKLPIDGTRKDISPGTFLDLTNNIKLLEEVLNNINTVLSTMQLPGLPPNIISSVNDTFVSKVLQEDPKYNVSLPKMLQSYSDLPVTISSVLMERLKKTLNSDDGLTIYTSIINYDIFKWFNKDTVSDIVFISLSKRTKDNNVKQIRKIPSPVDVDLYINESAPEVKEVSQTIPLNLTSDEDDLDLQVKVHRFDLVPGGKLFVMFLYPPTNVTLRVLIVKDFRPTYEMMMSQSSLITQQSPYYSPDYSTSDVNSFYYMGVLPGPEIPLNQSVTFSFTVNSTACMFWEKVKWSTSGCNVGFNTSGRRIHCQCSHLSIFGALFPFLPNQIDPFADAKLFLTVWDNPLVVSIILIIFIFYVFLAILAYCMDKKDVYHGAITVLEDNFPNDRFPYLITVYTSSRLFAGTCANVGIQLIGELANSRAHILKSKYYKVLERCSDDWFLILCPKPLGILRYLHMWHDNTGLNPYWYCAKVHVFDVSTSLECLFIVEQWLELSLSNYPEALIIPASGDDVIKMNRVLSDNISKSMREQRFVTGIFTQHPRSTVRRIHRVNIFTCSLLVALLCSIMFYVDPSKQMPDDYAYIVKTRDLYISIYTVAIIVSINYVITFLFKKSYKCILSKNRSLLYLRQSKFLDEYFDFEKQDEHSSHVIPRPEERLDYKKNTIRKKFVQVVKNIMKAEELAPAVLPHTTPVIQIKKVWLILAWSVCAMVIIVCMYLIMTYGLKMGLVKSKRWLTSTVISYVQKKIVINPLSMLLLAITLTATFHFTGTSSNYRATQNEIQLSVSGLKSVSYDEMIKKRQHSMYSPMKLKERTKLIKQKQRYFHMIQGLRFFLSLSYIITVFTLVQNIRSVLYNRNNHVQGMIAPTNTRHHTNNFYNAYDAADLGHYFEDTFLEVIYNTMWYNKWPLHQTNHSLYWTSDYSWRMVGIPYLRQLRVYEVPCHSIAPPANVCIPRWNSHTEDREPYSLGWSSYEFINVKEEISGSPWIYTRPTRNWLRTYYRLQGNSDIIYNNGGYKGRIGSTMQETASSIAELFDYEWIDFYTKVMFIELAIYNVNIQTLSQITIIVEFLTTDVLVKAARITSVVNCSGVKFRHIAFIILTFFFIIEVCREINYNGFTKSLKDIRSVLLLIIVIPSIFVIITFLIHVYDCSAYNVWERYYVEQYGYFDFDTYMSFHTNVLFILSFFLLFSVLRTLLLLLEQNLFRRIHNLLGLTLNIVFFLLLFTLLGYITLWQLYLHLDISTNRKIVDLFISQKKPTLIGCDCTSFGSLVFSLMKFCTVIVGSCFFISIFAHFNSVVNRSNRR